MLVGRLFEKYFKNQYVRIAIGGVLIILLSLIFKSGDYNGGGMNIVERIFSHSEVKYEAFLIKIIFTKKRNCLDIFLYLCALEFLPFAMAWKFIEQLSDFII